MTRDRPESCGRCSLSSAVDVAEAGRDEHGGHDDRDSDPYAGDRIEVDESDLRSVSPGVWFSRLSDALDAAAMKLAWR